MDITASATGYVGYIREFNCAVDDVDVFEERLEQFFLINGIKDGDPRMAGFLLTNIDNATYKLLQDLCIPLKPKDKTFRELISLLKDHISPRKSLFAERCKFHKASQNDSESIQEWTARLKNLSKYCKFEQGLDSALRDRFIVGLRSEVILNHLIMEPETLTFMEAVEIAMRKEAARTHVEEVKKEKVAVEEVHIYEPSKKGNTSKYYMQEKSNAEQFRTGPHSNREQCTVCGGTRHSAQTCRFTTYKCRNCSEKGHLARMCNSKRGRLHKDSSNLHYSVEETESEVQLFKLHSVGEKPIMISVVINGIPVMMEVDSGAGVSVISLDTYNQHFRKDALWDSHLIFKNYTQGAERPVGKFEAKVEYGGRVTECDIHVVRNGGPPLCGRDLMKSFDIKFTNIMNMKVDADLAFIREEYQDLFEGRLGLYKFGKVKLTLKPEARPIYCKPRPLPFAFKVKVEEELARLEEEGIITPVESSEWGTPLVPIIKKDGSLRLCADYKTTLNKFLEEVRYPLPRIEELFTRLQGGQEFTKLDMNQAYNQLALEEESQLLATWSTHKGLFKVNRLPYGVSPAAAKFQKMLEQLLQGLEGVANFLDDIVITGKNREQHMNRLVAVLDKIRKAGLKLKFSKCEFFKEEINYLGYVIDRRGIHKDANKVKVIVEASQPTSTAQVKSLVGMISYYSKFIPNLAGRMRPLYDLLGKDKAFQWTQECQKAFEDIKRAMCSEEILVHYDSKLPVKLSCDASQDGIGAVLAHVYPGGEERPIAYAAKSFAKSEKNYSMTDKEALGIYFGVKHFHQYLYGRTFTLVTDHKPLLAIFGEHKGIPQMAASRLQRWAVFLSGYTYNIQYIQGRQNGNADYLSRLPAIEELGNGSEYKDGYLHFFDTQRGMPIDSNKIRVESRRDPIISKVLLWTDTHWPEVISEEFRPFSARREQLAVEQGCLMWGYRVVVPSAWRDRLLEELHATHLGIVKMKAVARSYMWWPSMDKQIELLARSCTACTSTRQEPSKAALLTWQRPQAAWQRLHIDLLGPIRGKMYLIIIDAYTKWPEVYEMNNISADLVIHKLREACARFGLPNHVVTDNGTQFTGAGFQQFIKCNGIKHTLTAPGHPATNGQAENGVKSFKLGMSKALKDARNAGVAMETLMSRYLLAYRNAMHCTTLETPAKLMFGRQLRTRLDMIRPRREQVIENRQENQARQFRGNRGTILSVGETVMIRDYTKINRKEWAEAKVHKCLGPRTYLCALKDGRIWKRHINQIHNNVISEEESPIPDSTEMARREEVVNREDNKELGGIKDIIEVSEQPYNRGDDKRAGGTVECDRPKRVIKPPDRLNL